MRNCVLLADADDSVRKMVARVLSTAGYEVVLAGSAADALARLRSPAANLVLLDLETADSAGWSVVGQVYRAASPLPLIVMTSWPNQGTHAARCGVKELLEKPLDINCLLQTLERALSAPNQPPSHRTNSARQSAPAKLPLEAVS